MCVYIRTCLKSKYDMQRDTGRNKERERENLMTWLWMYTLNPKMLYTLHPKS